jgi:hypothetical protein
MIDIFWWRNFVAISDFFLYLPSPFLCWILVCYIVQSFCFFLKILNRCEMSVKPGCICENDCFIAP